MPSFWPEPAVLMSAYCGSDTREISGLDGSLFREVTGLLRAPHDYIRPDAFERLARESRQRQQIFRAANRAALLAEVDNLGRCGGADAGQFLQFRRRGRVQVNGMVGMFAEPVGNGVVEIGEGP